MSLGNKFLRWLCATLFLGLPSDFVWGQAISNAPPPSSSIVDSPSSVNQMLVTANAPDADLNGLAVISADRLCAVGNCGAILMTDNGGRSWSVVESPTTANLHAVVFSDSQHGLAVGGSIGAYTRTSRAVMLRTVDGGASWQSVPIDLPRLKGIARHAQCMVAWGDYSSKFKTGVFESVDGGATWRSSELPLGHGSAAGLSPQGGIVATDSLGRVAQGRTALNASRLPGIAEEPKSATFSSTLAKTQRLHHTGDKWIACGDGGQVLTSLDGQRWDEVQLPISEAARRMCSWRTVAQQGDHLWIGGSPGSILLHSPDLGATWRVKETGHSLPIAQLQFLDAHRGWAVGALGQILATRDGGQSWYAPRRGGRRAGVLAVVSSLETAPWAPLVAAGWEERVSAACLSLGKREPMEEADFLPSRETQLHSLAPQLAICTERVVAESAEARAQQMAVAVRTWRPDVLLTSDVKRPGQDASWDSPSIQSETLAAMELAKSPDAIHAALAEELGLGSWKVEKLAIVTEPSEAQYSEQSQRVLKSLGLAIWDVLLALPPEHRWQSEVTSMRTQWSHTHNRAAQASLLGGVPPSPQTARQVSMQGLGNYQLVMGRVHRRNSLEQLVRYSGAEAAWQKDLDFVIQHLPSQEVEAMLWDLSHRLSAPDVEARKTLVWQRLANRRPTSDVARAAMLELLKSHVSEEQLAWYQSDWARQTPKPIQLARRSTPSNTLGGPDENPLRIPPTGLQTERWNTTPFATDEEASPPGVVQATATSPAEHPAFSVEDARSWFAMYEAFLAAAPSLATRPDLQMLAFRMSERLHPSDRPSPQRLEEVLSAGQLAGWPQVAEQEMRYRLNSIDGLRWVALATYTENRPHLDGRLDEKFWKSSPPMELTSLDELEEGNSQSRVYWAYDRRYLYLALECSQQTATPVPPVQRIRTYDSDLQGLDHLQVTLDTDRDYGVAIELAVAADGRTHDQCHGRTEYDPKWHVVVHQGQGKWTAEIAVELQYLTTRRSLAGDAWAVSARRIQPSQPAQSWSRLRTHQPLPSGNGLLLFLPGP